MEAILAVSPSPKVALKNSIARKLGKAAGKVKAASYKFPSKKELARRLGVHPDQVHPTKKKITKYFEGMLQKKDFKNPDIGVDHLGNVVFRHPLTKKTIATQIPLSTFTP